MGRNRIADGSPEALFCEAYDQAATAVAALYLGLPVAPLTLVDERPDNWRYRDDILDTPDGRALSDDQTAFGTIWAVGSAAQLIAQNVDHPAERSRREDERLPAHDFARQHWRHIQSVAQRLLEVEELSADQLRDIVTAS